MDLYDIGKRIMDLIGSGIFIILSSPLMIFTAIFIKIVSPGGPVFADIPKRVTSKGDEFIMYKFRSMIPNAHQWLLDHPEWHEKYKNNNYKLDEKEDPRIIPGGKFIRKYSIDEFPQFFNVFKGEMSLVGPRAYYPFELDEQVEKFPHTKEYVVELLAAKPGISGVWQVSGRSEIGWEDRVKMDAEYAKKRSLVYDLLILLKTPFAVFSGKGAY